MRVVITGASGFLGRRVLELLTGRPGVTPVGVSRREIPGLTTVATYVDSPAGDVLVHLAEDANRRRVEDAGPAYESQASATLARLLEKRYSRVLYVSSGALYRDTATHPKRADDPIVLSDRYSRVKRAGEEAVLEDSVHPSNVVARLANIYGPGMSKQNVVSRILDQVPGEGPIRVKDDTPIRDFIWVDDAAAAMVAMALGTSVGLFNVGTGRGTSIRELAEVALDLVGERHRPIVAALPAHRNSRIVLDIASTLASFSWRPETSLRAGLGFLIERIRS